MCCIYRPKHPPNASTALEEEKGIEQILPHSSQKELCVCMCVCVYVCVETLEGYTKATKRDYSLRGLAKNWMNKYLD